MTTTSHDYYAILHVARNASIGEIKAQYRKLVKEHHPDQYNGLKAKYQHGGDKTLLKLLEEKIKEAEEFCKLLNEAFGVLSDSSKRRQYDEQFFGPKVEEPKISVSPKSISFGTLGEGQNRSSSFVIKNSGGPASRVHIDWEGVKPLWGDLIIEPDENETFPIKVTVVVDTQGASGGTKNNKVHVAVGGKILTVEIILSVRLSTSVPSASSTLTTLPTPAIEIPIWKIMAWPLIISCIIIVLVLFDGNQQQRQRQEAVVRIQQEANWALVNPDQAFTIKKTGSNSWTIKNNLLDQIVGVETGSSDCEVTNNDPVAHLADPHYDLPVIGPGETVLITCSAYNEPQVTLWNEFGNKFPEIDLSGYK